MEHSTLDRNALLDTTRLLIEQLESGDLKQVDQLVDEIASIRDNSLFQELGKLTRELHDSIKNFQVDPRITNLTETDIPDARERLEYVITMTEQSADKTLTAVEEGLPAIDKIDEQARDLGSRWSRFMNKEMDADEFRKLAGDMAQFFNDTTPATDKLRGHLNTVLMAQDFQDLTGQIIRRVINLVDEVEGNLVNLIRLQGEQHKAPASENIKPEKDEKSKLEGPQIPGATADDVMSSQDDVDDLLASLGF